MPDLETNSAPVPASIDAGPDNLLNLRSLTKQFPGVDALVDVDFDLKRGEVHILFGENGAGKSTLISIAAGVERPTSGTITYKSNDVHFKSVYDARQYGISAVFQEFSLVPQLTVEENLFLGSELTSSGLLNKRGLHKHAVEIIEELNFPLKPQQRVANLSRAEQQMVEIAKAFCTTPSVLIFDEPTASLTERETDRLFALIEQARGQGVGIIYITHRMGEIQRIGDRITVLRDGRKVATLDVKEASEDRLVELMTGRVIDQIFPVIRFQPGEPLLELDGVSLAGRVIHDISLNVRRGEIVGIAGLVGSGKSEIGRACFGLENVVSGEIRFDGKIVTGSTVKEMLSAGLFYVPSDRREEGLMMMRGARENISLASLDTDTLSNFGFLRRQVERGVARELAEKVELRPLDLERDMDHFSGGNQQKVLIAKALNRQVSLFIFDEPTVGVDVGTRVAIYGFIKELCEAGAGVLLISSDLPEILHLTNRTYVMYRGELRAELNGNEITQDGVLRHFFEKEAA